MGERTKQKEESLEVSLMSPKTVAILSPQQRRETIRENILNLSEHKIAILCHCTTRTIKRDVRQWRQEGGFEQFLLDEFFRSYPNIKEEFPDKAFDKLCYLLAKTMVHKVEAKTEHKETVKIDVTALLQRYEETVETATQRNLQENHPKKQMDTCKS